MIAIRDLTPADWPAVEAIYREGIATGNATFEAEPPSWANFDASKRAELRLVADDDGAVVGWVAASSVSTRAVYDGVVEHSVYVAGLDQGRGIQRERIALMPSGPHSGQWRDTILIERRVR